MAVKTIHIQGPEENIKTYSSERFPGLPMQLKVASDEANGAYEVWQVTTGDEEVTVPFIEHHNTFCSMVVTKGSMDIKIGNDTSSVGYKTVIHMLPYTPYGMTIGKDTNLMIVYAGEGIKEGIDKDLHEPGPIGAVPWGAPELNVVRQPDYNIEVFNLAPFYTMPNKVSCNEAGGLYALEFLQIETSKAMPAGKPMLWDQHCHHEHCETFYVMEGSVYFGDENGKLTHLMPGTICHAPVGANHTLMVREDALCFSLCNPPNYQEKINQLKTMMNYHWDMYFTPPYVEFQSEWDKQFEHHGLSTKYKGVIEEINGTDLKVKIDGKTEKVDLSPDMYMLEPEIGTNVTILGNTTDEGLIIAWKAWKN